MSACTREKPSPTTQLCDKLLHNCRGRFVEHFKNATRRECYARPAIEFGWSRNVLVRQIVSPTQKTANFCAPPYRGDKGQRTLLSAQEPSRALGVLEYYHLNGTLFPVNGTQQLLWSNLGMLLAEHNMSVLGLHKRLQEKGVSVNLKSLYRLAGSQPLQKFDARIVKPICLVLGVDLSELISLEEPKLSLLKLDPVTQARITGLLDKNNQGTITKRERSELERLVDKAEKISLHNARALVEYRRRRADKRERRSGKESEATLQV